MDFEQGEVLLFNKPYTWTSFDLVKKIRNTIRTKKIGHAGTLDPLATGLLIMCTRKKTKEIENFQGMEKEYTGTMILGATTPCFDKEMEVDKTYPTDHITADLIHETIRQFTGHIKQVPPAHSAVKVDGKRAYEMARKGREVTISAKDVEIKVFEITKIEMPAISFRVVCSKGTYIRSLARDFGIALESGAYLDSLCRTRIGHFELKDAWELDDFLLQFTRNPVV